MTADLLGTVVLLIYYILIVTFLPVGLKRWLKIPSEYIRKTHHILYSLSIFIVVGLFSTWYIAVGATLLLAILGYPALLIIENMSFYKKLFPDRAKGGELRKQLVYVQISFAILLIVFWGLLGPGWKYVAVCAVMAWGFGDAAAALVGKRLGRKRKKPRFIERAKTYEGTAAMIVTAGLAVFLTLLFYAGLPWPQSILISIIVAPFCGIVELLSRGGSDTITVPLATSALISPLIYLIMFLGF